MFKMGSKSLEPGPYILLPVIRCLFIYSKRPNSLTDSDLYNEKQDQKKS